jgi:hypothetical protein
MAQSERTTATDGQIPPPSIDGGVSRPMPEFPTDRELVARASDSGNGRTARVPGEPSDRVSSRLVGGNDRERHRRLERGEVAPEGL